TSDGARPVPSPAPARAPAGTTTYKFTSMELSPQLKKGSCLYRVRYGNFSNVAFAQVRTYSSGCGNMTVSVYGQNGTIQGTWNSSSYSVRNHGDGCGTYNERQATSSENQIAIGMAVTFNSLGGTTRFMYHSGGSLPAHRNC
ncbi:hypothetical protein ACFQ07_09655, partial [Actinomadura adrarensis]